MRLCEFPRGNRQAERRKLQGALARLCTFPGSRILDPFAGSGSTLEAARLEGYDAIGVELSPEIAKIASERLETPLRYIQEVHYAEA